MSRKPSNKGRGTFTISKDSWDIEKVLAQKNRRTKASASEKEGKCLEYQLVNLTLNGDKYLLKHHYNPQAIRRILNVYQSKSWNF
ncbi:hypothetical protein H6G94_33145 [Nostoc punctiforme FACHB-252]|uniref:Arm DNA-binding domain-containing protein n=1 Tax=Nostoc punctiforme FACHB-252 TaxID=1357509 RepID=A0ABR8HJL5_NOSPU|nr:hypothetical protein [Nostoc punctiforme]MBD2616038.1 hypothetical protein [Nostoc punctiforme FACHB-252]